MRDEHWVLRQDSAGAAALHSGTVHCCREYADSWSLGYEERREDRF